MSGDRPTMPPVRLPSDAELARDALSAPLFARAAKLARWAGEGTPVGAGGELLAGQLRAATALLGLEGEEDGTTHTAEAWQLALDTGLVEFTEEEPERAAGGEGEEAAEDEDEPSGTARVGEELATLTSGSPQDILEVWLAGLETVLADAATPDLGDLVDQLDETGDIDLDSIDWNPEEEADFLDGILGNLYLLTAIDDGEAGRSVPLPALAASLIVPDDMDEPTDDVLEEVSDAMMRLDDQFRLLEPTGLVRYQPVDESLIEEIDGEGHIRESVDGVVSDVPEEEDVSRYGMVALTPLGLYGVRARMLDAGIDAPAVGDLAEADASALLAALPGHPEGLVRTETELWLARRAPLDAARELLAAARGTDEDSPRRRLACQQTLSLLGAEAEPALREVLDDPQLGGLARVWLAERGAADIPEPGEAMVFWLTIDTIAAQLAARGDDAVAASEELRGLVVGLVSGHSGFFDAAWRVDHPATAEVLEAMGRLHPDKKTAKEARKAAFKARSRR
ncbi:hypothetical protein [Streptomyces griseocarneus]|uniref:hypothetical protein n=1 Tax=Streptomyces griseocarneus TaxID=51201 RepID=UPI00167E4E26|nr:hypothetical protein [Streptomyces griseocarneus]MBZ6471828.1 hypothetical protein [Streptomyces griseocarneus]GHG71077.1 hypothetical protein GCM10018779_45480 [Streptomyces griseocarneus]